jgi:hypothetical protein
MASPYTPRASSKATNTLTFVALAAGRLGVGAGVHAAAA